MLAALPILTRIYSPNEFKILAVFMSSMAVLTVIGAMRFDLVIPITRKDIFAINVLMVAFSSALAITAITIAVAIFFDEELLLLLGISDTPYVLWLLPIALFFSISYQVLQYWTSRKKRFSLISKTRVTRSLGGVSTQLGLGLNKAAVGDSLGLVIGQVVYNVLGVGGLLASFVKNDFHLIRAVSLSRIRVIIRKYRYFAFHSVPEALMNALGTQLPIIIIAASSNSADAGVLLLVSQVTTAPLALLGQSVGQVFLANASQYYEENRLGDFAIATAKKLLLLGGPLLIVLGFVAPFVFGPLFGQDWERAGVLVSWAIPWAITQFIASPISTTLHTMNKTRLSMNLQFTGVLIRTLPVVVASVILPSFMAETYVISSAVFYSIYVFIILKVAR